MAFQNPIKKYRIRHEIPIDIRYHKIHPNIVSEFEVMEACVACNYNWEEFLKLPLDRQAVCVAQFRMHNRIDSVVNQEVSDYSKKNRPK